MRHCHQTSLRATAAFFVVMVLLEQPGRLPAYPASVLAPPAPHAVTVPFDLIGDHIYLQVRLDGQGPYWFALDTGARNALSAHTARALGIAGGRATLASVDFGALRLTGQSFAVLPLPSFEAVEGVRPFGGLMGYELFQQYAVRIDYERHALVLTPPREFTPPAGGVMRGLTFAGHIPQITARLDGVDGTFNIDTGDRRSLAVFQNFRGQTRVTPTVQAMTGWGVRGPVWSQLGRAQTLEIGPFTVRKPVVEFDLARGGAFDFPHAAGNIGGGLLEQFTVTLDYAHRRAFFEKNAHFGRPIVWDRCGMWVNQEDGAFTVVDVTLGGPAAQAGLHAGDRIVGVDGHDAALLPLPVLRLGLRLNPAGTAVRLTVCPQGSTRTRDVVLVLKDLV